MKKHSPLLALALAIAILPRAQASEEAAPKPMDEHGSHGTTAGKDDRPSSNTLQPHASKTRRGVPDLNEQSGYDRNQMIKRLNEQFQEKRKQLLDNPDPRHLAVLRTTAVGLTKRIKAIKRERFPIQEVDAVISMYDEQMRYSKERWDINHKPGLTPAQRKRASAVMEALHAAEMNKIHAHGGENSLLITALHSAIDDAVEIVYRSGDTPTQPDGYIPTGQLPGNHGDDMQNKYPDDPTVWELGAKKKLAGGDRAGGLDDLNRSIANGGTADAYTLRAVLRIDAQDFSGALQDAKKALELNPGDKNVIGVLKSAEGRTAPRLSAGAVVGGAGFEGGAGYSVPDFDPRRTHEKLGTMSASTLASSQKLDEARRALEIGDLQAGFALAQRALELNPNNAAAHNFLSVLYARMRDYPRAIASANAGLALAPRDGLLLNSKAFAENRLKLYHDALASANGAIEADPRNPYAYANRAYAFGGLGDKEAMLADINRAAGIDPRFEQTAVAVSALQLPAGADILFLFPGEKPVEPIVAAPKRRRSFGLVVVASILGGLLLALGLLSTVLATLKDSMASAFAKVTRRGPTVGSPDSLGRTSSAAGVGLICGHYEIMREIGSGGMGMVYEGKDHSLGRRVAIKKMREELRLNPRERERFIIEAKTVASLRHPSIVDIYAIEEAGMDVYLVFEYVDGKTVHEHVQIRGRFDVAEAVRVTIEMGSALTYAHSCGVIHRDMKPSNVMLNSAGQVKVMDFGIARMAKDALTRYSMTNTVVGTPPYMAPEQEQGLVRKESDVYSLAICAYEMLTGKLPFIGIGAGMLMNKINMIYIPPARAIAGLPKSLDDVFLKAFLADPEKRYRTPQEFCASLASAVAGDGIKTS